MFTNEQKIRAVKLLLKTEMNFSATIAELGYPSESTLYAWYKAYNNGTLTESIQRKKRFTLEQRQAAVDHYIKNGKNYSKTVREMGYPTRQILQEWVSELAPEERKQLIFTEEEKRAAVERLKNRGSKSALAIAEELGVNRETLYKWKNDFERKESGDSAKPKETLRALREENDRLKKQNAELQKRIQELEALIKKM